MATKSDSKSSTPKLADYRRGIIIFIGLLAIIVYAGVQIWQAAEDVNKEYEILLDSPALKSD